MYCYFSDYFFLYKSKQDSGNWMGRYRMPAHFMLYYKQKIQEPANVNYPFNRTGLSGKHSDYNNNY